MSSLAAPSQSTPILFQEKSLVLVFRRDDTSKMRFQDHLLYDEDKHVSMTHLSCGYLAQ